MWILKIGKLHEYICMWIFKVGRLIFGRLHIYMYVWRFLKLANLSKLIFCNFFQKKKKKWQVLSLQEKRAIAAVQNRH